MRLYVRKWLWRYQYKKNDNRIWYSPTICFAAIELFRDDVSNTSVSKIVSTYSFSFVQQTRRVQLIEIVILTLRWMLGRYQYEVVMFMCLCEEKTDFELEIRTLNEICRRLVAGWDIDTVSSLPCDRWARAYLRLHSIRSTLFTERLHFVDPTWWCFMAGQPFHGI
jgi:hypothetical protein